jgi:hypothetical protein
MVIVSVVLLEVASGAGTALCQQATIQTPQQTLSDSFYERNGVQWGVNWPGGFFRFGGPGAGVPPFGGYLPGAGAQMGVGFGGPGYRGYFNATAAQGFRRGFVAQTPMLTLTNGIPGFVADASLTPFVMGYVPVVGGYVPGLPPTVVPGQSPVAERIQRMAAGEQPGPRTSRPPSGESREANAPLNFAAAPADDATQRGASVPGRAADTSTATQAVPSVAQARAIHAAEVAERDAEAQVYWEEGQSAEADGKIGAAKVFYQMAVRRASGEFRDKVTRKLDSLKPPPKPQGQEF